MTYKYINAPEKFKNGKEERVIPTDFKPLSVYIFRHLLWVPEKPNTYIEFIGCVTKVELGGFTPDTRVSMAREVPATGLSDVAHSDLTFDSDGLMPIFGSEVPNDFKKSHMLPEGRPFGMGYALNATEETEQIGAELKATATRWFAENRFQLQTTL